MDTVDNQLLAAMQVFVSVVDSGSFSESARRLGISQPSASRQVNALEEHLGVRLLQRSTRRLSLTEAGQIYYEKARRIQQDLLEAQQSVSGFRETPSGVLRISTSYAWVEMITPLLSEFLQQYPQIKLDIECNDQVQNIIEDQLDLVIRVGALEDSSFIAAPISPIRMVACATRTYLQRNGAPWTAADLSNHSFVVHRNFSRMLVIQGDEPPQPIKAAGLVSSNALSVMLAALRQHLGLAVLPDLLINHLLETGELVNLMPEAEFQIINFPVSHVYALYSDRKHLPAKVRAFLDFFRPRLR